jgi:hypothetical protein
MNVKAIIGRDRPMKEETMPRKTLEEYKKELSGDISAERRINVEACIRYLSRRHQSFQRPTRPKLRRRKPPK